MYSHVPMTMYVYTAPDRFPLAPPLPQKYAQNGAEAEVCRGRDLGRFPATAELCRGRDLGRFPATAELFRGRDLSLFPAMAENL